MKNIAKYDQYVKCHFAYQGEYRAFISIMGMGHNFYEYLSLWMDKTLVCELGVTAIKFLDFASGDYYMTIATHLNHSSLFSF